MVDPNGNVSAFAYDQNRRLTPVSNLCRRCAAVSSATTPVPDGVCPMRNGNGMSLPRDPIAAVTANEPTPPSAVSTNAYDANGNLVGSTDSRPKERRDDL